MLPYFEQSDPHKNFNSSINPDYYSNCLTFYNFSQQNEIVNYLLAEMNKIKE